MSNVCVDIHSLNPKYQEKVVLHETTWFRFFSDICGGYLGRELPTGNKAPIEDTPKRRLKLRWYWTTTI